MKGLIPTLHQHWTVIWLHLHHSLKPMLSAMARQFWSAPGLVMTSFLIVTFGYAMYCRLFWRFRKKFWEV